MKGIVLASHGQLAEAMLKTAEMFYGKEDLKQIKSVSLKLEDPVDDFKQKLRETVEGIDTGQGVVVLIDILGGTPGNQAGILCSDKIQVVTGMNLAMFVEVIGQRMAGAIDIEQVARMAQDNIVCLNSGVRCAEKDFFE